MLHIDVNRTAEGVACQSSIGVPPVVPYGRPGRCAAVGREGSRATEPDGADAIAWYVSLSRAREAMYVYTRDKSELRQSATQPGEGKSVWEFIQALRKSALQSKDRTVPHFWATRQAEIVREMGLER